jgi:serine/threonine protein kinase
VATTPLPFPQESTGSVGPAAPLPAGAAVAHLTIERVLHEGLHSVVYLVRDPNDRTLALMEYFPRALALRQPDGSVRARQAGDAIALSVGREAFVLEANTLERIEHAGIVRVLGSLQAHRTVYRAMEFIDGPTLERHIEARGAAASAGAVVRLLDQVLDALDALHRAGVVHGCVRPDQILMAEGERPVLLGMGSAGAEIVGHEAGPWSAPEQAAMSRHDRLNSATDLYMAAATAWCFATGDTPPALRERLAQPDAWDPAAALADLPEPAGDAPGTRARLAEALTAALALLPSERPQRVADLRRLLQPGPASARSEPAGTVPLWVGAMPDRDQQWEVYEKEVVLGGRAGAPAEPSSGPHSTPHSAPHSAPASELRLRLQQLHSEETVEDARATKAGVAWRWWWIAVPMLLLALLAGGLVVWSTSRDAAAPRVTLSSGLVLPEAGASASALPVPAPASAPAATVSPPGVAEVPAPPATAAPVPAPAPPVVTPPTPRVPAPAAGPAPRTAAAPPAAARPKPAAPVPPSPRAACGNRSQFALLYCMQDQCSKPALRNHPQCNQLRRSGDIQ